MDETAFHQIQRGDIVIALMTKGTWTPYVGVIKAVVTDGGVLLGYPAIVAREYGIPAVAGCLDATRKIKAEDRIRVDGDMCAVHILSRKAGGRPSMGQRGTKIHRVGNAGARRGDALFALIDRDVDKGPRGKQ